MKSKERELIQYLNGKPGWVKADEFSFLLGVSTRQVRYYISAINTGWPGLILTSRDGYKLSHEAYAHFAADIQAVEALDIHTDVRIILKIVAGKNGCDIGEIAAELFLSFTTVENYLHQIRRELAAYDLTLHRRKDIVYIEGAEREKRRLMHRIFKESVSGYSFVEGIEQLLGIRVDVLAFQKAVRNIITGEGLFINDYALTSLLVHLMIAADRSNRQSRLEENALPAGDLSRERQAAQEIIGYVRKAMGVCIADDLAALVVAIGCSTNRFDHRGVNTANLTQFVDERYIRIARSLIDDMNATFFLGVREDEFIPSFAVHVQNLFSRTQLGYMTQNPLTKTVKRTYPLVYDIAVFLAQKLMRMYDIFLTEDEIAYLSFHIGGHMEANAQRHEKVKSVFVYAEYYDSHLQTISCLHEALGNEIYITAVWPGSAFRPEHYSDHLIISAVPLHLPTGYEVVEATPFFTNAHLDAIRAAVASLKKRRRKARIEALLVRFFHPALFFTETYPSDEAACIFLLAESARSHGLVKEDFYEQVLQRELLSPTSFVPGVAVPHSLTLSAHESFIAVLLNRKKIRWYGSEVRLVLLIGISKADAREFRTVFDFLIEAMTDPVALNHLLCAKSHASFVQTLIEMI